MKELYEVPEVKLVCFVARDRIAANGIDFNDFFDVGLQNEQEQASVAPGDIRI